MLHYGYVNFCVEHHSCADGCDDIHYYSETPIHEYETDPLKYLSFHGKPEGKLFLGVELEVEVNKSGAAPTRSDKAKEWVAKAENWFILKADSSLDYGFEIVTAPSSLEVHQTQWNRLLGDSDLVANLKSWNTSTCGMHVHASRAAITPLTLGKVLVFLNSQKTREKIVGLAGREMSSYALLTPKKVSDSYYENDFRNEALNLQNTDTIEFRIFRGTLHVQHVLANIEFCDALIRWAKEISIRDCESWEVFVQFVRANKKQYTNLIQLIT